MKRSRSRSPRERRPRKRSHSPLSRDSAFKKDHRSSTKLGVNIDDNFSYRGNKFLQDGRFATVYYLLRPTIGPVYCIPGDCLVDRLYFILNMKLVKLRFLGSNSRISLLISF